MVDKEKEKEIAQEYREFWKVAEELATKDLELYPLEKHGMRWDRLSKHLIGMLEMYSIKYGYSEEAINYRCAWKALKASLLALPEEGWSKEELFKHLTFLELDCKIEAFGDLLKTIEESRVKVTTKQKKYIRFGLWVAGLCWSIFFLVYTMVIFDRAVLPWLEKTYTGFPLWVSAVFYILCALSAVFIFFWFFTHLMRRKK